MYTHKNTNKLICLRYQIEIQIYFLNWPEINNNDVIYYAYQSTQNPKMVNFSLTYDLKNYHLNPV